MRKTARMTVRETLHQWGLSLALLPLVIYVFVAYAAGWYTVLDTASLIVHQAGHFFFRPFGWTLYLLGGSIYQLILPSLFV
ncbi:MAG: hypothetical protein GVY25_06340 [Bacteroidetes bacterium]|jgi:hypothetical protein|nr:hypothetical protein [Bacteroidota bacterium]